MEPAPKSPTSAIKAALRLIEFLSCYFLRVDLLLHSIHLNYHRFLHTSCTVYLRLPIFPLFCNLNLLQLMTSASPTISPILVNVRLVTSALLNVIPLMSFSSNAIVPVVGSVVEGVQIGFGLGVGLDPVLSLGFKSG